MISDGYPSYRIELTTSFKASVQHAPLRSRIRFTKIPDVLLPTKGSVRILTPVTNPYSVLSALTSKIHTFDNAAAPKDAENRISQLEEILMFSRQGIRLSFHELHTTWKFFQDAGGLHDQSESGRSKNFQQLKDGSDNHRNNNQDSGNNDKFLLNFSLQPLDSQQSRVFPESCTLLFMPNVVVETQESVVMLPEIASSAARLATFSKMARRTLRQVPLVTLTRKPDISGRVFAISQNQTTNISEELSGISSHPQLLGQVYTPKVSPWDASVLFVKKKDAEGITMDPAKVEVVTKIARSTSKTEARSFLGLAGPLTQSCRSFLTVALTP
ncbi:hypothetical protein Tco_0635836 [Tanacetum coccineum]